ncbi:MAG: TerC family protein [Pseudomonadota bacterium]
MLDLIFMPEAWAALVALIVMEIVLGIDNLIFISIVTNELPEGQRERARKIGIALALILRLLLLVTLAWIVGLTAPVIDLGISGPVDENGHPAFETAFSIRDLILIVGGGFLVWKATMEIHHKVDPNPSSELLSAKKETAVFSAVIAQIIALDVVFSVDSILTAVGMTPHIPIMVVAVVVAVAVMFLAADPVSNFVNANPTVVMLALAFLLMIGMVLIADGFGHHVPKGYIYAAMAFAAFVEMLNMLARRRAAKLGRT